LAPHVPTDGAAVPRRSLLRHPLLLHTLGLLAAAVLAWLVWRGYRQPGLLLDLANAMFLC
jgi:threonine/homoserine/homoserine lactone efflux protein